MRKIYVLDTNVLIHSPEALLHFEDNEVVLPIVVLEELDGLKNADQGKRQQCKGGDPASGNAASAGKSAGGCGDEGTWNHPDREELCDG